MGAPPTPFGGARPPRSSLGHPLRLRPLQARFGSTPVLGLYALVNGLLAIGVMTGAAMLTGAALVFPSLGPTAHLLFSDPLAPAACPRNALLGHGIGVAAGWGALAVFGLTGPMGGAMAVTPPRIGAAAVSLAVTSALMVWLGLPHPPAAATTLIVSLGILAEPLEMAVLMLAVLALVVLGVAINRLAGVPTPLWGPTPTVVHPAGAAPPTR